MAAKVNRPSLFNVEHLVVKLPLNETYWIDNIKIKGAIFYHGDFKTSPATGSFDSSGISNKTSFKNQHYIIK